MKAKLGLQLYSIREECEKDFLKTLTRVSEIGYDGVEFYSLFDSDVNNIGKLLKQIGLKSAGFHVEYEQLKNQLDEVLRWNSTLESEYIVLSELDCNTSEEWKSSAEFMNTIGQKLMNYGFKFLYHNHNHEFERIYEGNRALDILLSNTSKDKVSLELDCFWVKTAGINPVEYLQRNLNRVSTIHLKDMTGDGIMTEVGTGIIDCASLIKTCDEAGFDWIICEQDDIRIDNFESIKISHDNARKF